MDPETPMEPPPPAYETEQDFDRKVSDVLERSLNISSPQAQQASVAADEWEEWDEAKFEAAAAAARAQAQGGDEGHDRPSISRHSSEKQRLAQQEAWNTEHSSAGASSSTSPPPVVPPLNVGRRLPSSPPVKEQPSWFAEAGLDTSGGSASDRNYPPSNHVHDVPPEEEDPDEPLPPFAPVGPSLEGPPFEDVVRDTRRLPPGSHADSPPESPLDSVEDSDALPVPPPLAPPSDRRLTYSDHRQRSTSSRQSTPAHSIRTSSMPSSTHRPPPMRFDPSIAYKKPHAFGVFASDTDNESKAPVDASAFYNSAVSSFMGPSQQSTPPKKSNSLNRGASAGSGAYGSAARLPYSQAPQIHTAPPALPVPPVPAHNSYYPAQGPAHVPTQYAPYSQPPQLQQVPAMSYGGYAPGPTQPHWPPPNNMYGGGSG